MTSGARCRDRAVAARSLRLALLATVVVLVNGGCRSPPMPVAPASGANAAPAPSGRAPTLATGPSPVVAGVTVASFELDDASRPRRIPVRLAYPAAALRAGASARLPVVVFSHGGYSSKDDYPLVTDRWAARGYFVVAVTHSDSVRLGVVRGTPTPDAWAGRIADVRFLLAHLEALEVAVPALRGRLDTARIALAGHSFGGLIAQAFGGMSRTDPVTREHEELRDPRIRAVVILSGVGPFTPETSAADFRTLTAPLFVSVGTEDLGMASRPGTSGLELRREPFELAPPGHKYLLVLRGADHYLGGMVGRDDLPKSPHGPQYVAVFDELSGRFLDAWLKGDGHARARLDALAVPAAYAGLATLTRG